MKISVSILDCDDRIKAVEELNNTSINYIHVDVMDGKFVSGIQFQEYDEIYKLDKISKYPLDIHFMMENPIDYIRKLSNMNIGFITIHLELDTDIKEIIDCIHSMGYKVGLSIKPNTNIKEIEKYLEEIDMVLVMSVVPGIGGQKFMMESIDRIHELKKLIEEHKCDILIEVDGGINDSTINYLDEVDIAVVGSFIVKSNCYQEQIEKLLN